MSEPAVAENTTTCQVEDVGPACKRITITIPAESIKSKVEDSFRALQLNANVPGFRRGKVPRTLLEKRFGGTLRSEAKSQLMSSAFSQAVEEHKLRMVGQPELGEGTQTPDLDVDKPLTFSVEVEVVPQFDLPSVEGTAIVRPVIDVTDEHVAAEMRRTQLRFGTPNRITGPFEAYDRMIAKAVVRRNDETQPFFESDKTLLVVPGDDEEGKGQVLGLLIEDLRSRLEGHKVGDTVVIETVGPEAHEREDIRGAKLAIELTITDAERVTPDTAASVAQRLGLVSEEALREQIRLALEQRRDLEQRAAMREQLYERLLDATEFPLPEKLSVSQFTRLVERQRVELLHRGLEPDRVETQLAAMRAGTAAQAQMRLKLFFILAAFGEKLQIGVSEQEVNGRVFGLARQRGVRPDQLRAEMQKTGTLTELALQIREHKVADRLLEDCTVTDMPAEEWNRKVMELQARLRDSAKQRLAESGAQAPAAAAGAPAESAAAPAPAAPVRRRRS